MANYFKDNLKYIREQKGLSKNKLSELTGVNQSTIGRWENGEITPTIDNVIDLMNALNLPISKLGDFLGKDFGVDNSQHSDLHIDIGENVETKEKKFDELELLFDKAKPHLSDDDKETMKFLMQKTINNYEKSKNQGGE